MEVIFFNDINDSLTVCIDGSRRSLSRDKTERKYFKRIIQELDRIKDKNTERIFNNYKLEIPPIGSSKRKDLKTSLGYLQQHIIGLGCNGFSIEEAADRCSYYFHIPDDLSIKVMSYEKYNSSIYKVREWLQKKAEDNYGEIDKSIIPQVQDATTMKIIDFDELLKSIVTESGKAFVLCGPIASGKTYGLKHMISNSMYKDCAILYVESNYLVGHRVDDYFIKIIKEDNEDTEPGHILGELYNNKVIQESVEELPETGKEGTIYNEEKDCKKYYYDRGEWVECANHNRTVLLVVDQMHRLVADEVDEIVGAVAEWIEKRENAKVLFSTRNEDLVTGSSSYIEKLSKKIGYMYRFSVRPLDEELFRREGVSVEIENSSILTPLVYKLLKASNDIKKQKFPYLINSVFDVFDKYYESLINDLSSSNSLSRRVMLEDAPRFAYYTKCYFGDNNGLTDKEINKQIQKREGHNCSLIKTNYLEIMCNLGIVKRLDDKYSFFCDAFLDYMSVKQIVNGINSIDCIDEASIADRSEALREELAPIIKRTNFKYGKKDAQTLDYATFLFLSIAKSKKQDWTDNDKKLILKLGANVAFEDPIVWNELCEFLDWYSTESFSDDDIELCTTINGALYEKISSDLIQKENLDKKEMVLDSIKKYYWNIFPFLIVQNKNIYAEKHFPKADGQIPSSISFDFLSKLYGNIGALYQEYGKLYLYKAKETFCEDGDAYKKSKESLEQAEQFHKISQTIKYKNNCSGIIRSYISIASDYFYRAELEKQTCLDKAMKYYEKACCEYEHGYNEYSIVDVIQQAEEKWILLWRWSGCMLELHKLTKDYKYIENMINKQQEAIETLRDAIDEDRFAKYRNRQIIKQFADDLFGNGKIESARSDIKYYSDNGVDYKKIMDYVEIFISIYNDLGLFKKIDAGEIRNQYNNK